MYRSPINNSIYMSNHATTHVGYDLDDFYEYMNIASYESPCHVLKLIMSNTHMPSKFITIPTQLQCMKSLNINHHLT